MGKLVETTYKAGPDDKLAVVDVYKASDSGIVNSYQDSFGDQDISDYDNAVESSSEDILNGIDTSNSDLLANTPDPEQAVLDQLADEEEDAYFQNKGYNPLSNKTSLSDRFGGIGSIYGGDRAALTCSTGMFDKQAQFGKHNPFGANIGAGFNLNNVASQLANGNMSVLSAIKDIPKNMQSMLTGGVNLNAIQNNVLMSVGGVTSKLTSNMDYHGLQAVTNLCTGVTGGTYTPAIQNRGGLAALIAGVTQIATSYNLPNVFSSIAKTVTDPGILLAAAKPLIQSAAYSGNVDLFRDVANSSIGSRLPTIAPSTVPMLLGNMQRPTTLSQQSYPSYYQDLRKSLDTVQPGWATYNRSGGSVVNATVIGANPFACDLISSQMNEFMHPNNYLSNAQQAFPALVDTTTSLAYNAVNLDTTGAGVVVTPVDSSSVVGTDLDFTETFDLNKVNLDVQKITDSGSAITSFDNEPFLLLGQKFKDVSVDSDLSGHFPEFYETIGGVVEPVGFF